VIVTSFATIAPQLNGGLIGGARGSVRGKRCSSPGVESYSSATAMLHAWEEFVGHIEWLERSLIFIFVGLEWAWITLIYGPCSARASSDQSRVFIAKDAGRADVS
jgi:hypothetical protein